MVPLADAFTTGWTLAIVSVFLVLLALGKWHSRRAEDIQDKDRFGRWGTQAEIEERDIAQMIGAENDLRRRHGRAEVTEAQLRAVIEAEQAGRLVQARNTARRRRTAAHARERRGF